LLKNVLDKLTIYIYLLVMKYLQVGEFKSKFSKVLEDLKKGEEITISFGKKREKIAVIIPYSKYKKNSVRKLGMLEKKASFKIKEDFSISDEELLNV
jgi:antitoxin (DNA-binding transcriptional repressor) of toxin-antitoxin stability system